MNDDHLRAVFGKAMYDRANAAFTATAAAAVFPLCSGPFRDGNGDPFFGKAIPGMPGTRFPSGRRERLS